ncbi:MAG: hypothetical protein J1E29_04410 [Duncaniella sp.]|nr:hypothetical protein [Duncaniella sp.]
MKHINDFSSLLKLIYELEGLLLLADTRRDDIPAEVLALITEKTALLNSGIAQLAPSEPEPVAPDVDTDPAPMPAPAPVPAAQPENIAEPEPVRTLDERIAHDRAADITKAFTLNDKFRFRRELFHNSDAEFVETLDIIAAMTDFSEEEEYFYDDLCWDASSPDVKAFMEIVSRHF